MCGFAGMFRPDGILERDRLALKNMSEAIRFRGPDENSLVCEDRLAFAFRRLSIIDLSGGSQPKTSDDGKITGVFNGEIYNYRELKETLAGESFETASELEILLKLYRKNGGDCAAFGRRPHYRREDGRLHQAGRERGAHHP